MSLTASRFIGDPTLEDCLDGTHRMLAPERGPAVKAVQQALIDLGLLPEGSDDSQFGPQTGGAVVAFKTSRSIFPNDAVVGKKTMQALDREFVDKPPAPFSSREEWLSWRNRGAVSRVGSFNFTRQDEFSRRAAGAGFTFDSHSTWLPATLRTALTQSLSALLDPHGSPSGPGTAAATWGVGPFDLYHCHLVLWTGGVLPVPPQITNGVALQAQVNALHSAAAAVPGAVQFNAAWTAQFRTLLLASGLLPKFGTLASDALAAATIAQPLMLVWHSFEHSRWRPPGMTPASPQRHWQTTVAPTLASPIPFPFTDLTMGTVTYHLFQIAFMLSKTGVITAMPGSGLEAASMLGLTWDEISAAQG